LSGEQTGDEFDEDVALDPRNWLELFGDNLFHYALTRVNNNSVAEEIVQDTMLGAVESWKSINRSSSVKTWLFAILKNKLSDYFRKKSRSKQRTMSTIDPDDQFQLAALLKSEIKNEHFQNSLERDEFWQSLESCMEKLPFALREVFRSRLVSEDASVESLSAHLEISVSNFNVRMFRARLILRKCLERLWLGTK
jgi:RNA polymerase sigma factor (sigma-70 family)